MLADWRARDIERRLTSGARPEPADARWLLAQLHIARTALTEIIALAHEVNEPDGISLRIRAAANRALGLYAAQRKDAEQLGSACVDPERFAK